MNINIDEKKIENNNQEKNVSDVQETKSTNEIEKKSMIRQPGVGLDCGTMFDVSAFYSEQGISFKTERNAFFDIEDNNISRSMLNKLNASFVESLDKKNLYILGNQALHVASFFNKECRRPFSKGVLSSKETEALMIIKVILHSLVGDPIVENEKLYFSVPADPIDSDFNNVYHMNVLKSFLTSFHFDAEPMNEAFAIIWSELEDEKYTGISLSFGAGSVNVALSLYGISSKQQQFCLARSGDFIDTNAAQAVGVKTSKITMIKENGVDLLNPKTREETAIKIYYENLISYTCNAIEKKFNTMDDSMPNFPESIAVVISGGTSKAINFDVLLEQELKKKKLPFSIKQVKKASDPLNAVARGCLLNALQFYNK